MMSLKWVMTAACAAAILVPGIASYGQNAYYKASGSSAMFNQFGDAAKATETFFWYGKKGTKGGVVNDAGAATTDAGDIWIAWSTADNTPGGTITGLAYYVSVDSTVGDRAFYNFDTLTFQSAVTVAAAPVASDTGFPGVSTYTALPASVITYLGLTANKTFNVGMTDITPADAKVATARFGPGNTISGVDGGSVKVVDFDPTIRNTFLTSIGAAPILFAVNASTTGTKLGTVTNIDRFGLSLILSGQAKKTSDVDQAIVRGSANDVNLITFVREGLSGTYNTTEYCVPNSLEAGQVTAGKGQELNVVTNPLNQANYTPATFTSTAGGRARLIGTSSVLTQVQSAANSLGYFFFSQSNASKVTNTHYLKVDGIDPLFGSGYTGTLSNSTTPDFTNIKNGGYSAWSILRMVTEFNPTGTPVGTLLNNLNPSVDFVPANSLTVFRSHRGTPEFDPSNGINDPAGSPESGADAGGAVFTYNQEKNYSALFGLELTGVRQ